MAELFCVSFDFNEQTLRKKISFKLPMIKSTVEEVKHINLQRGIKLQ